MKLSHLPPEDRDRITRLGANIRSMEEVAAEHGDPVLSAMVNYLGAALLSATLKLAEQGQRIAALEESFEAYLEAHD